MAFFEGLKIILPAKIAEDSYDYDLAVTNSPKGSKKNHHVDSEKKIITIYLDKLSPKELRVLEKHTLSYFGEEKLKFTEKEKVALVDKLYKYDNKSDELTLKFFKNILSKNDFLVLRESLFLREDYINGNNISNLKHDIILKYGERGNIIANLCTAGYFEEVMMPLFNSSQQEFYDYYDIAVDRGVKAFFVNARMSIETIRDEIKRRLISAKSYGIPSIHIHGIGQKNIKNIKTCLEKEKEKITFVDKKIYEKDNVIIVEIIL